jgi:hypothetical protein
LSCNIGAALHLLKKVQIDEKYIASTTQNEIQDLGTNVLIAKMMCWNKCNRATNPRPFFGYMQTEKNKRGEKERKVNVSPTAWNAS